MIKSEIFSCVLAAVHCGLVHVQKGKLNSLERLRREGVTNNVSSRSFPCKYILSVKIQLKIQKHSEKYCGINANLLVLFTNHQGILYCSMQIRNEV